MKEEFAAKFGRWIEDNEIVIEDLSEKALFVIAEKMFSAGYSLEYWKAEKQKSGHLHIKNIQFPGPLIKEELKEYKQLTIEKYCGYGSQVDMQLCGKHRIAEENKQHYKGYGIKLLIKTWNKDVINWCEQNLYLKAKKIVAKRQNRKVVLDGVGITAKIVANVSILQKAKQYGFNPDGIGRSICLFHGGTNQTSLKFFDDEGRFVCFSCGLKGNIVDFVSECKKVGLKKNG